MAKFICSICGYIQEGAVEPLMCPVCKSSSQFTLFEENSSDENQGMVENTIVDGTVNKLQSIEANKFSSQEACVEDNDIDSERFIDSLESTIVNIIKTEGINKAIEWYKEKNNCDTIEAIVDVRGISLKNKVYCTLEEENEMIEKYWTRKIDAVKWYMEKNGCGLKEAKEVVDAVFEKHLSNSGTINETKNGCMQTLLLAFVSTLSIFWLI